MRRRHFVLPALVFLLLGSFPVFADYHIPQCVIAGGGGTMTTTGYSLTGTVAQTVIGRVSDASHIHLIGFWYPAQVFASAVPEETGLPVAFALGTPYPNPGGPMTTLRLAVPRSSSVALRLYDVSGRLVRTLLEGELPPGYHTVDLDGAMLAAGIYFCRLTAPGFRETRRLVLVK
jgi:hypothetical protein